MKVLVTTTSGAGHVHPVVPLARALSDAGHDVVWAIAPEAVGMIEGFGFRARAAGLNRDELSARTREGWPDFGRRFLEAEPRQRSVMVFPVSFVAVSAPAMLEDLRSIVEGWHPDVIVHEPNELAAAPLAAARRIPHVVVGFGAFRPDEQWDAAEEPLRELWRSEGLDLHACGGTYDDIYLHPLPPSLGPPPSLATIERMRPMGFDGAQGIDGPAWLAGLGADRPCVYVTFGTEAGAMAPTGAVAEALGDLDVDVLMTVGGAVDPSSVVPHPPNVRVERYVPQRMALNRSSLLVSHAGSGAMLGGAAQGVPQLCLPIAADQFTNADLVAAAGCGLVLEPHDVNTDALRHAVRRLLAEDLFRQRAARVRQEIADMPEPAKLVSLIEALVP